MSHPDNPVIVIQSEEVEFNGHFQKLVSDAVLQSS